MLRYFKVNFSTNLLRCTNLNKEWRIIHVCLTIFAFSLASHGVTTKLMQIIQLDESTRQKNIYEFAKDFASTIRWKSKPTTISNGNTW